MIIIINFFFVTLAEMGFRTILTVKDNNVNCFCTSAALPEASLFVCCSVKTVVSTLFPPTSAEYRVLIGLFSFYYPRKR